MKPLKLIVGGAVDTMALFFATDDDLRFGVALCNPDTLHATVYAQMYCGEYDPKHDEEISEIVTELRNSGKIGFEDGWLELRVGLVDTVAFLVERATVIRADEKFADNQAAEAYRKFEAADQKYKAIRDALLGAIGNKLTELSSVLNPE